MAKTKVKDMTEELSNPSVPSDTPNPSPEGKEELEEKEGLEKAEMAPAEEKPKKKQKPGKRTKVRSKKYQAAREKVDKTKAYPVNEAVNLAKASSYSKYDGTFEIHLNTKIKNLRGFVSLPYASGRQIKVLAFGDVKEADGIIIGTDETLAQMNQGKLPDFDILITTPAWMPKITPLARFLGPRGLMPNPKNNTITSNIEEAIKDIQSGKMEYKSESSGKVIHLAIGKVSQPEEELAANVKTLVGLIGKTKISKVTLSPTLGIGVKVDLSSI